MILWILMILAATEGTNRQIDTCRTILALIRSPGILEAVSRIEERIFRRSLPVRETLLYRDVMLAHAVTSARRVFFPFFAAMLSGRIPGRLPLRAI
jgi:hypothetical protein